MMMRAWHFPAVLALVLALDGLARGEAERGRVRLGIMPPLRAEPRDIPARSGAPSVFVQVSDTVYDSLAEAPLAGADVQLLGEGSPARVYDARTDSLGEFSFGEVAEGAYLAGFFHPSLDSLGIEIPARRVVVSGADRSDLALATPSRATIFGALCPDSTHHEDGTLLVGVVRSAVTGAPMPGAMISVQWSGLSFLDGGLSAVLQGKSMPVSSEGRFSFCNVPPDAGVTLRAAAGVDTSGAILLTFPPVGITSRDIYVAPRVSDELLSAASLSGRVTGRAGTPIAGARVSLAGWESAARTDSSGRFSFPQVPGGSTMLEVRGPGIEPVRIPIDLRSGPSAQNVITVVAQPAAQVLAPITVVDRRSDVLLRSGFDQRRQGGFGRFVDDAMLEKMPNYSITAVLSQFPGTLLRAGGRGSRLYMRDPKGLVCAPTVWVDGTQFLPEHEYDGAVDLDLLVDPSRVAGIEIYRRVNQAPLQFAGTTRSACGVIVIWRKER